MIKVLIVFVLVSNLLFAQKIEFDAPVDLGIVDVNYIDEASGLAASRINPDILWTHNDDGQDVKIFAINTSAKIKAIYLLPISNAKDLEDIAIGPGPEKGKDYIYLGDIGDNDTQYSKRKIYRFLEPIISQNNENKVITINDYDVIEYKYPDKKYDSEALMIDPTSKDIFIVSKRLNKEKVFKLNYPQSINDINEAEFVTEIPFGFEGFDGSGVTAADISRDGSGILIKNYSKVYYFHRGSKETVDQALSKEPISVRYSFEPQGEAVAWHPKGFGYYTLSELSPFNIPAHLYFYPKKGIAVKKKVKKKSRF